MEKPAKKSQLLIVVLMIVVSGTIFITSNGSLGGGKQQKEEKRMRSTLEETLEEMEGIGKVAVYFHYDEKQEENSLAGYFSISSESERRSSQLKGLLVAAEGAEDPAVRNRLSQVLTHVLQLPEHRIVIVEMKKRGNQLESK